MQYEALDAGASAATYKTLVEQYRTQIQKVERGMTALKQQCTAADRKDLLAFGGTDNVMGESADADTQAARLVAIKTTEKLQSGTKTLLQAEKYINQSQELGQQSLGNLRTQRETLENIQNTTHDVDGELLEARHIISGMQRTATKHKVYLWSLIALLVFFVVLIYLCEAKVKN
ncbi:vesicle transport through interaction with t-SNARE 1 [Angomonas deanei]|nr:vesicle transport through interaction with t-SNARE 1 [Angomonas deanei]|eukprot:EPY43417.1 vesicle transport through interaction with t-SNARE 1 [Angomonas deanei]